VNVIGLMCLLPYKVAVPAEVLVVIMYICFLQVCRTTMTVTLVQTISACFSMTPAQICISAWHAFPSYVFNLASHMPKNDRKLLKSASVIAEGSVP
jgi:hypothetical protein